MTDENLGQQIADLRDLITRTHTPEVMTPPEAATFLGVAHETLFRWRKDQFGPRYSQPTKRTVRYLRSDLLEFLKESQG
jgi:predicted DNA-binding transcriptional regulator AlpA